ncbi:unnamed protein product [Agarophyton chilense]
MVKRRTASASLTSSVTSIAPPDTQIPVCVSSRPPQSQSPQPSSTTWYDDRHSIVLLVLLYAAQGLPIGLAFGTIPFLLKERGSSYADLAEFSLASMPYSLKLIIAPFVDAFYSPSFGRRKSWIVPVQMAIGCTMLFFSSPIHHWVSHGNVAALAPTFFFLIALVATQDIAVDGWSLTMLKKENVAYVRPLLLSSRSTGALIDLQHALRFVGVFYLLLTAFVAFGKNENAPSVKKSDDGSDAESSDEESSSSSRSLLALTALDNIRSTYRDVLVVVRLPAVQALVAALLVSKLGFSAYDNVLSLKLLELGFSKESMASMAVIQAPFTIIGTVMTGRLVANKSPTAVYVVGYFCRLVLSLSGPALVGWLSSHGGVVTPAYYSAMLAITIMYSVAAECLMFIGMGAFFLNISSSSVHVAGSYLTLLNTSSNMGGLWHKAVVLWLVDKLTVREQCEVAADAAEGSACAILRDGYYTISVALMPVAALVGLYLMKTLAQLKRLPESAWRASR